MSLFFDHLVSFSKIEKRLQAGTETDEEKHELWGLVDEILHHRVMAVILEKLPPEDHNEFLERYHKAPYDMEIIEFINLRVDEDITKHIRSELKGLEKEMLKLIDEPFHGSRR